MNIFRNACLSILLVFGQFTFSQDKIDSLKSVVKAQAEDTNKALTLSRICKEYLLAGEYSSSLPYGKEALALSQKLGYKKGIALACNHMALVHFNLADYTQSLSYNNEALKLFEELKDKKLMATTLNNLGENYRVLSNFPEALKYYFNSLKLKEGMGDQKGIANSYNNIGLVYRNQNNLPEALNYYNRSLELRKKLGDKKGIAASYNNIGTIYEKQGKLKEALKMHQEACALFKEINFRSGLSASYVNIGIIHDNLKNYDEALKNYQAALEVKEQLEDLEGIATCYINMSGTYIKLHKMQEAQAYLKKALKISTEINSLDDLKEVHSALAMLDSAKGDYRSAFEHQKLFILYRDSINNEESNKKSLQTSMQYEFDKKEIAAKAEQEKLNAISAEEKQKQRIVIFAVAGVLLLVIIFSVFLFNRFRITQKQKTVIEQQKVLVDQAYESLHEKNKEVMDSIYYASRIQKALITNENYIQKNLTRLNKSK